MEEFYYFTNGVQIDDNTINDWIQISLDAVYAGASHYSISCGDSSVFTVVYDGIATIQVANLSGIATIHIKLNQPRPNVHYTRPTNKG